MVVVFALAVALCIVGGQALWKQAVSQLGKSDVALLSGQGVAKLLTSPYLLLGTLLYAFATIAYIVLLSKFKYFQVQSLVVGSSLVLTLLVSTVVFREHASIMNLAGVLLILGGMTLIIR